MADSRFYRILCPGGSAQSGRCLGLGALLILAASWPMSAAEPPETEAHGTAPSEVAAATPTPTEPGTAAAGTAEPGAALAFEIPQAVFVFDPANTNAVDPFFPNSKRRYASAAPSLREVQTLDVDALAERFVFLRGLTGPVGNQVALLNNQPLKVGDTFALRLEDANGEPRGQERLKVQLLHIVDNAVVLKVEGGTREHVKQLAEYGVVRRTP